MIDIPSNELCKHCEAPAQVWSQKALEDREYWCSHTCKLKARNQWDVSKDCPVVEAWLQKHRDSKDQYEDPADPTPNYVNQGD